MTRLFSSLMCCLLVALGTAAIGQQATISGSLFSQFKVEQDQEADRQLLIINDVLAPLFNWSAFDIEIREPMLLREPLWETVLGQVMDQIEAPGKREAHGLISHDLIISVDEAGYQDRFGLMLPYSMRLKPEYVQRLTSVLENTADRVGRSAQECNASFEHLTITFLSSSSLRCYIFEYIAEDFLGREDVKAVTAPSGIAVQLFSTNGDTVNETVSRRDTFSWHSSCVRLYAERYECEGGDLVFHDFHLPMFRDMNQLDCQYCKKMIIFQELEGLVLLGMTEDLAQNAARISFGPRQSSNESDVSSNVSDVSSNEPDAFSKSAQCWNTGALSSAALRVKVVISAEMTEDGEPIPSSLRLVKATGGEGQAVTQAYEAARRAILRCGVSGFDLPKEKYDQWREIEMTFDPKAMLARQ